jgi:hypothetical protein
MSLWCYTLNIKTRLIKLEQSFAVKAKQPLPFESREESRQWLHDAIQRINERRRLIDEGIIENTYTPQPKTPLLPHASPAKIWLDNILNEIEIRHEH